MEFVSLVYKGWLVIELFFLRSFEGFILLWDVVLDDVFDRHTLHVEIVAAADRFTCRGIFLLFPV